ncbi:MAG: TetR/AcrR family transcriptional regulator [Eubacteriales bacterium]|nr:TetR/AcrR family transcriptional regulator [Eubacteriales bacterium]
MPKIIPDLKKNIIKKGREILFQEGYDALSMRRMAGECGIAVGTIYNYMRNKDDLVAHICMEDWFAVVKDINDKLKGTVDFVEGVEIIYRGIVGFRDSYSRCWKEYSLAGGTREIMNRIHPNLREQVAEMIEKFMYRTESEEKKKAISFMLAELLIAAVTHSDVDDTKFDLFIRNIDIS